MTLPAMDPTCPTSTILIVDDDVGLTRLIEKLLQREGYNTVVATSGQEAREQLVRQNPDLILLDLKLKDIHGQELIQQLRKEGKAVPYIVITGQGDEQVAVEVMKQGAIDYLVKTARFLELIPTVVKRSLKHLLKESKLAHAEEALKRENALMAMILDTCGALIMVLDRGGRICRFNRACEVTTGYTLEEAQGKVFWDLFIVPEDQAAARNAFKKSLSGQSADEREVYCLSKSGVRRLIAWSDAALLHDRGQVEHVLVTGIDITHRKQLEQEMLRISDYEKQRIGQDLHDGLGQQLTGIELMTQVLEQQLTGESRRSALRAREIAEYVREAIHQTRALARGLSPVVLESEGLTCGLQELAVTTEKLFKVSCSFRCDSPVPVDDHVAATHLYRIAQEAVSNAVKHGKAKRIEIGLTHTKGRINLAVKDNGVGLSKTPKTKGIGLRIMRYRAGMIGGSLAIQKEKRGGTTVVCSVHEPIAKNGK